jgi:NIMA (never in mitosis gene a)-related kinase
MSCVDFYREPKRLIIVMEKAQNDLWLLIYKHKQDKTYIDDYNVKEIFLHICLAIKYLHDRKLLHRDIKPSNVLIFTDGTIKVSDLGTAK